MQPQRTDCDLPGAELSVVVYLERAGTGLRSGSGSSGLKCSESELSDGGLLLRSDDTPLVILPSLLQLLDLRQHTTLN